jgi:hypothetical protein
MEPELLQKFSCNFFLLFFSHGLKLEDQLEVIRHRCLKKDRMFLRKIGDALRSPKVA